MRLHDDPLHGALIGAVGVEVLAMLDDENVIFLVDSQVDGQLMFEDRLGCVVVIRFLGQALFWVRIALRQISKRCESVRGYE